MKNLILIIAPGGELNKADKVGNLKRPLYYLNMYNKVFDKVYLVTSDNDSWENRLNSRLNTNKIYHLHMPSWSHIHPLIRYLVYCFYMPLYTILKLFKDRKNIVLIKCHGIFAGYISLPISKVLKIPTLLFWDFKWYKKVNRIHNNKWYQTFLLDLYKKIELGIVKSVDFLFVSNSQLLKEASDSRVKKDSIFLVPNFIELSSFAGYLNKKESLSIKKKYRLEHKFVLLFVGQLVETKGIKFLIEAIPKLVIKIPNITLLVVGDGPLENNLKTFVRTNHLDEYVFFLGKIENEKLPLVYTNSNIFVFPTHFEGFPVVLLEAWATKTPIISTNVEGVQNLIKNKINGYLIEKDNQAELIELIYYLSNHPSELKKIREEGWKTVLGYDSSKIEKKEIELISRIITK